MIHSHVNAFPFLKSSTSTNPYLHAAVLLFSAEVDTAFKEESAKTRELVRGHWMLTGVVSSQMFNALRVDAGKDITGELGIIRTSAGAAYLIICSELGARQHRHVLPLFEGKVMEFLTCASRAPFRMFIESAADGNERMLYTSPLIPELFVAARDACQEMDLSRCADFVLELPQLIAHVAKLDTMRSVKGEQVRDVDVSILLPYEARARYSSMDGSEHGRSAYCH